VYPAWIVEDEDSTHTAQKSEDGFDAVVAIADYMRNVLIRQPGTCVSAVIDVLERLRIAPPPGNVPVDEVKQQEPELPEGSQAAHVHQLPPAALHGASKQKRKVKASQRATGSNATLSCKTCGNKDHDMRNGCKHLDALGQRLTPQSWSSLGTVPVLSTPPPPAQSVMPKAAKVLVVTARNHQNTHFLCAYHQDVQLPQIGLVYLPVDVMAKWCNWGKTIAKFTMLTPRPDGVNPTEVAAEPADVASSSINQPQAQAQETPESLIGKTGSIPVCDDAGVTTYYTATVKSMWIDATGGVMFSVHLRGQACGTTLTHPISFPNMLAYFRAGQQAASTNTGANH
jgi:hypothetical protein